MAHDRVRFEYVAYSLFHLFSNILRLNVANFCYLTVI